MMPTKPKEKKQCAWCDRMFMSKRPWHLYHSGKCRKAAFDARRSEMIRRYQELVNASH